MSEHVGKLCSRDKCLHSRSRFLVGCTIRKRYDFFFFSQAGDIMQRMLTVTRSFIVSVRRCTGFPAADTGHRHPESGRFGFTRDNQCQEKGICCGNSWKMISLASMEKSLGLRIYNNWPLGGWKSRITRVLITSGAEGNGKMSGQLYEMKFTRVDRPSRSDGINTARKRLTTIISADSRGTF